MTNDTSVEIVDYGDAMVETGQWWFDLAYPDNIYGRGPFPVWSGPSE